MKVAKMTARYTELSRYVYIIYKVSAIVNQTDQKSLRHEERDEGGE